MKSASTANLHIRSIPMPIVQKIKSNAKRQKVSINACAIDLIARGLGLEITAPKKKFHDLDHLAGTWNKQDEIEFLKLTHDFNKIDKELW